MANTIGSNPPLAADAVFLIRSDVKVAIPHLTGGNEEINATLFGVIFVIFRPPYKQQQNNNYPVYHCPIMLSIRYLAASLD
jgi:hypothetical protein